MLMRNIIQMGDIWLVKGVFMEKLRRKKFLLENSKMDGEFHGQGDKRTSLGGVYVVLMTNPD